MFPSLAKKRNVSIIKGQGQNDSRDFLQHKILKVCVCVCVCVCVSVCVNDHVRFGPRVFIQRMYIHVCARAQAREWMI